MFFRILAKRDIGGFVRGLSAEYELVGPVVKDDRYVFATIDDVDLLRLDYDTSLLPLKRFLFPPEDQMMRFRIADNEVLDDMVLATRRAILGAHACDINALLLMDNVFLGEYEDPYYRARRDATLVIGLSCTPSESCFCNVWNANEAHKGYDLFLTDLGESYFVSVRTAQGADVLDRHVETSEISREDTAEFQRVTRAFKESLPQPPGTDQLPLLLDARFDDPFWDELGERCFSCGSCSMVCPTCHCFDVVDDLALDRRSGTRTRVWDSCQFSRFSAVAHGGSFRATRASRIRNRYYHKQAGYLSRFERVSCVGCGRCARACLAGISPREVISALVGGGSAR